MNLAKLSDNELIALFKDGSEQAVTVLTKRYKPIVSKICRKYFLIGGDNEDLIQEGMIALFRAIKTFNGSSNFIAYASKCIKNQVLSVIKRYNSQKNLPLNNYVSLSGINDGASDKTDIAAGADLGPEATYINAERLDELNNEITKCLSKLENKIFTLYLDGLTYQEISDTTGKNLKSIDNTLQRIKKKVQEIKNAK